MAFQLVMSRLDTFSVRCFAYEFSPSVYPHFTLRFIRRRPRLALLISSGCAADPRKKIALCQKRTLERRLFDQLVGGGEQRLRDGQAKRFGGLEVDGQYQLCWKFDRQIVSLGTFQDPVHVVGGPLIAC